MKTLTQSRLREVLEYDPSTGLFKWLVKKARWLSVGDSAGALSKGRLKITIDGNRFFAHRLAWLYCYGKWPIGEIDHMDGNPLNNKINNLRDVPHSINAENQKIGRRCQHSGLTGVYIDNRTGRFFSAIRINGKFTYLGRFDSKELAHQAWLAAKRKHHSGFVDARSH